MPDSGNQGQAKNGDISWRTSKTNNCFLACRVGSYLFCDASIFYCFLFCNFRFVLFWFPSFQIHYRHLSFKKTMANINRNQTTTTTFNCTTTTRCFVITIVYFVVFSLCHSLSHSLSLSLCLRITVSYCWRLSGIVVCCLFVLHAKTFNWHSCN